LAEIAGLSAAGAYAQAQPTKTTLFVGGPTK
jgi:hypothetical protein